MPKKKEVKNTQWLDLFKKQKYIIVIGTRMQGKTKLQEQFRLLKEEGIMKLGIFLMLGEKYDRIEYKGRKVPNNQLNKYADHDITIEQYEDEEGFDEDGNPIIRQLKIVKINEKP